MGNERTKAVGISALVRAVVYSRDSWEGATCCALCGSPRMLSIAHYIARSQSGKGIEQNLITLCLSCHATLDQGYPEARKAMRRRAKEYLQHVYGDSWREEELRYRRE